jgi:hypothetical protein
MVAALAEHADPTPGRELAASMTWEAAARAHLDFYANA